MENFNKYLGIYTTSGDVQTAINEGTLKKPYVALVDGVLDYNTVENQPDYTQIPLTFEILSDGNISWLSKFDVDVTIEYSKNGGAWTSITSSNSGGGDDSSSSSPDSSGSGGGGTTGTLIPVVTGDIVQFRGTDHLNGNATFQTTTAQINVYGNINSLITTGYATNPESVVLSINEYSSLFAVGDGASFPAVNVISAENLVLPSTTLDVSCYHSMFYGCTSLTTAPELPATTLADEGCYAFMFVGCSSLNYIKCLATDISGYGCTDYWVDGVASTGTFVKASSMTDWTTGSNGIPSGWTVVEE